MDQDMRGVDSARHLLVGQEVSAVCFVRDYVELQFDGPIFRALTAPFGMYGCTGWRLPGASATGGLLRYIGLTVDDFVLLPGRYARLAFGEHSFTVPLDDDARTGPEALHIIGVDDRGETDTRHLWIW
jgi:hypothetical protein